MFPVHIEPENLTIPGFVKVDPGFPRIIRRRVPEPFHTILDNSVLNAASQYLLDGVIAFADF